MPGIETGFGGGDGGAGLEVDFTLNTGTTYRALETLDDVIGSTAAEAVRQWQKMQAAVNGFSVAGATGQMATLGETTARELRSVAQEKASAEKAAERMVFALEREAQVFGKSTAEIRNMRAEVKALAAEEQGLTEVAGRLRAANAEMNRLEASTGQMGATAGKSGFAVRQFGLQIPDIAGGLLTGQKPMQVFIQQGGQIAQVAMMAQGGVKGFAMELAGFAVAAAPVIVAATVAAGAFALFDRAVTAGIDTTAMVNDLGLTRNEIKKLKDTSVGATDVIKASFQVMAERAGFHMGAMSGWWTKSLDFMTEVGATYLANIYGRFVGTFRAIGAVVQDAFSGQWSKINADLHAAYDGAAKEGRAKLASLRADITNQAIANKRADLEKQAALLKADRTPKKDKVDHHAEQLEREARATEAQIKNLYGLADAYGVSGAAALIAEARAKAESAAINKRADVEAAVDRQIRLAIAERVKASAASAAGMRDQATTQADINGQVAAGLVPAFQAAELVRDQIADLPLQGAIKAAQAKADEARAHGDLKRQAEFTAAVKRGTDALAEQRGARAAVKAADIGKLANDEAAVTAQRLADLRTEAGLIGATAAARVHELATINAQREALIKFPSPGPFRDEWIKGQVEIADKTEATRQTTAQLNEGLRTTAQLADDLGSSFSRAFGQAGDAIGQAIKVLGHYGEEQQRIADAVTAGQLSQAAGAKLTTNAQMNGLIDLTDAARGLFKEHSRGAEAMMAAEKALTVVQLARTAVDVAGGAARMFASLGPYAFPAVAAMLGVMASLGFKGGGSAGSLPKANDGSGTVFGNSTAQSESLKRSIDALKEVDTTTSIYSREMAASLRSIENQVGGLANVLVRSSASLNADSSVTQGFKTNATGQVLSHLVDPTGLLSKIPIIGDVFGAIKGAIKSLFGTTTTVQASGLYGGAQSIGSIESGGLNASTYSDVEKVKKFLGITTGRSTSTVFGAAPGSDVTDQFALILKGFDDAIVAAAGPLGAATSDIAAKVSGFVFTLGKVDLKGLTGDQIAEKLEAIFGAAADQMAGAAFPGLQQFAKVGEGAFETLTRVASTVEAVTMSLDQLGMSAGKLGIGAKLGIADQFDSVSAMTSATDAYFTGFYTAAEQSAAKAAQLGRVFDSIGIAMPDTLASFRALVEAQDLTSAAGQSTYATLLQLAPAFADLKKQMEGAKSAADVLAEQQDLQRQLLELQGNTAAIRALDLAKLDASNRALQQEVWAVQDAQKAAEAASDLREAWTSVGDSIMDEVKRIRGLTDTSTGGGFAQLLGQFNAATAAARGGDQDMAKSLPGLSQALLSAAADAATSRQELARVQAQTAASLEATYGVIGALAGTASTSTALDNAATVAQATAAPVAANDDTATAIRELREELAQMRSESTSGLAAVAGNTGRAAKVLENVSGASGGDAVTVALAG